MAAVKLIHCIGDSHSSFFSGFDIIQPGYPDQSENKYPFFKSYRLGSVLAYNLNRRGSKEQGFEKLNDLIGKLPKGAYVMLCFGEIDCRCHLIKQSEIQNRELLDVINDCIYNYFEVVDSLKQLGFNVFVWNVIPTAESDNKEYPTYGSMYQRNQCSILFNRRLNEECNKRMITFISIFNALIDKKLKTKSVYYFDSIHLGQLAMPFVLREFKKVIPELLNSKYNWVYINYRLFLSGLIVFLKKIKRTLRL